MTDTRKRPQCGCLGCFGSLMATINLRLPRQFNLSGVWRGPNLVLDDQKSMFIHLLPDGYLTPNPISTTPVPDRHASVTLARGALTDFGWLCAGLKHGRSPCRRGCTGANVPTS
jgi:hypothetical protein